MKYHKEHFDWGIILSANAGKYVQWQIHSTDSACNYIVTPNAERVIQTDASMMENYHRMVCGIM